ncbi:hypothetical protein C7431_103127 [Pantoea allii]|uniref:Uncharacterized protein n=1 Tax=Pantoea allii TaxID=574096 RepID=A0A2V2BJ72_9GAMM|nr:hypothetical protein C7431_103127 [Pantoea allii]TWD34758.1 hypothetical protein FBY13_113125 [Pantoea sp. SJZ147]
MGNFDSTPCALPDILLNSLNNGYMANASEAYLRTEYLMIGPSSA